ncbi:cation:H+ antiporter [Roseivirga ehrenbergii]|uniref:Sodium:proton exchanger n=1 Tax=Roseivirga ehrenbergii (strain DSM 102268 / JCM 13514 / KCTC 12282 / NCIMB 14502 / KMM 6017) TaxID=279360 RepID=A0A150X8E3_ROSEK|nr:calcium/sodium antiporter [Roseivirga ehrenbergii]KYG74963.1 sodium:proton exchanger [Roseivirga ehrenbergii]TCL13691.1 cation:H+ antiporter [Roseivirga ehrenbergii]
MIIQVLLLISGLALLITGAHGLVDGASALAKKFKVSDLAIGLTIVAFGTSAPELVVSVFASFQSHQDIVFGNVIGSNNFNLFIILGITGLIAPMVVQSSTIWKEIPISFLGIVLVYILTNHIFGTDQNILTRIDGLILLILFGFFLYYVYNQLKSDPVAIENKVVAYSNLKTHSYIIFGLAGLVTGGRLLVTTAVDMATTFGMSEKLIGLTIVAAGTSLPELATSVVAAFKKNSDIAVGNIIGSNIFNLFFILATSAVIRPIAYDTVFDLDLYILAGGTIFVFMAMFTGKKKKLDRWEAAILMVSYIAYLVYVIQK